MTVTSLSRRGAEQLARAEEAIERGLTTFVEVGQALVLIRGGRLYREQHESFEAYCRSRWKFSSRRANQLMDAAEIGTMVPISNERQARELAPLKDDPEAVQAAYDEAAASGDVTTASLATAVEAKRPNHGRRSAERSAGAPEPRKIESGEAATREGAIDRGESSPDSLTPKTAAGWVIPSSVASWAAAGVPVEAIDRMPAVELSKYRIFALSVFKHASATIDYIDAPSRLKAVKS